MNTLVREVHPSSLVILGWSSCYQGVSPPGPVLRVDDKPYGYVTQMLVDAFDLVSWHP